MTQEEKVGYFKMAASFCNFAFSDEAIELLTEMYELVLQKEGKTDLHSLVETRYRVLEKHKEIEMKKLAQKYDPLTKTKEGDL
jgi:hypothetical protein